MLKTWYFLILHFDRHANGWRGAPPPPALPWLRYSHRMSKNYQHRTLIFLLSKVYFVQRFIQHTVTNNVIKLHSRRHFYSMFYQIDTLFVRNHTTVLRRRVARNSQLGGCVFGGGVEHPAAGGQWGFGGKAPSRRRHEGLGAEPPALENFAFFCKNNFMLGLF